MSADGLAELEFRPGPVMQRLLLRAPSSSTALVTIYNDDQGTRAYVNPYRSVFERLAPSSITKIEELAGIRIGQSTTFPEISEELLEAFTLAFREARHPLAPSNAPLEPFRPDDHVQAKGLLESLVGQEIRTVSGRPNRVVVIDGDNVIVATGRAPDGQPVPIEWVQRGLQRLFEEREVEISVSSLGHRSAFVGAVLLSVPGAVAVQATPPRVRLTDPSSAYRMSEAGHVNAWWQDEPRERFWLRSPAAPTSALTSTARSVTQPGTAAPDTR